MKLIECYIENFGKLSDFKYSFSPNLNTILEENGYGKTTFTVFIKSMLYGLDSTKRTKLEENDRKHYLPWNKGRCGGSLTFETEKGIYRAERTFMPKASEDEFKLYNAKDGKESFDYTERLGEELFGVDVDGFERTVFLSENNLSGKNDNKTVSAKLSDLVGCDADLAVMDDAIDILEKQRKSFYRKGGAGEIGEIKEQISSLGVRMNEILRLEESLVKEEENLKSISTKLADAKRRKEDAESAAKKIETARQKESYRKQYLAMKAAVETDEASLQRLGKFFENGVPSAEEAEKAKDAYFESRRLKSQAQNDDSDAEYGSLAEFFAEDAADEEYQKIKTNLRETEEARIELAHAKALFEQDNTAAENLPSEEETERIIKEATNKKSSKNTSKRWQITLPLSLIVISVGIFCSIQLSAACIFISVAGALLLLLSIKNYRDVSNGESKDSDTVSDFISAYCGDEYSRGSNTLPLLYALKAKAAENKNKQEKLNALQEKIHILTDKISENDREACEFISKFPLEKADTVAEAVNKILRKKDLYEALKSAKSSSFKKKEENAKLALEYEREYLEFLSKFPTVTERPFDEISSNLLEYTALSRSVKKGRESVDLFAKEHGIDGVASQEIIPAEIVDSKSIDAEILELEKTKTLAERTIRHISEETEIYDSLLSEKNELTAREALYTKKFNTIIATQKFLKEAKDSLTAKYLSKTKSAFNKYVSLIGSEVGEDFQMNTSFEVMKNEKGSYKERQAYSRGTKDLYALATRLALVDSLYENESPFIILDDPFAYFDDEKLERAISVVNQIGKEKQILYLTCQKSRSIKT